MIIPCPYCGPRDSGEFTQAGDADPRRPPAGAGPEAFADYVYARNNPAGLLREHWHHVAGCRSWLVVERDTRSHAIRGVRLARQGAS